MLLVDIITAKRDKRALSADQIRFFIRGVTDGSIPDYQAAALLMATYLNGLDDDELSVWFDAMLRSGDVLDLGGIPGVKVDKHSTGGVGDSVSIALAPIVASCGVPVPMISGRGLGHTGGTLDKLESIPGFRTDLSVERFAELVGTLNCGLIGQTAEIAPADRRLYALRDVTATVECIPLIASSILSKKLAEGIDALVLDVKFGSGAFMRDFGEARRLASTMLGICQRAGKNVVALLTDMDSPLGTHVGNALEIVECLEILDGSRTDGRLRELTLVEAAEMLVLGGVEPTLEAARSRAEAAIASGEAFRRFEQIVEAQHGDPRALTHRALLPSARERRSVRATRDGFVAGFACADIGRAALRLGAGRARKEDRVDPAVGIVLTGAQLGTAVRAGDELAVLHINDPSGADEAHAMLLAAIHIEDIAPRPAPLVRERLI